VAEQASRPLALFDFDGTLCRLETDYDALRAELERLGGDVSGGLLALMLSLADDPRAAEVIAEAEAAGLECGGEVEAGVGLYRSFAEHTRVAIVSHNGREVIEAFVRSAGLPEPEAILDRTALGGPKDESDAVPALVGDAKPVYVIGDGEADRRLAERLGASFLDPADELRAYYEGRAGELDELALTYEHPEPYKRFFYGARFRAVLDALDPQAGEEILEIGCGSGAYTRELVRLGARVTATEVAPGPLAQARRNLGSLEADLRIEDAQSLSLPDERFDKVLLSEVIEHVPDPDQAIAEAARVLRRGGLLVVSTPSRLSPMNLAYAVKRRVRRYGFNEHLHELTPGSFRRLVGAHLDVVGLAFANFVLPYPSDELYLRLGSPGLGLLRSVERGLAAMPVLKRLGWTMILRARKPA
jgi:SAM-dependent methyltransferase